MKIIEGGVCAAKGFKAGALHCGIRKSQTKKDLAMIRSDCLCNAAAVYTKNQVKAAPVLLTKEHLADGKAQAVIINSGNANACAPFGMEHARRQGMAAARALEVEEENVVVASTGIIGQTLPVEAIEAHAAEMEMKYDNSLAAAEAIKTFAVEFEAGGTLCHMGGICKGSGMIHPNMGTMLCFITTDCAISANMMKKALLFYVDKTFNRVTVDGDTSTNDMCVVMANGMAGNKEITEENESYDAYCEALHAVMKDLARKIAGDGEGASRLITCTVTGAEDEAKAEILAKSIASSSLTKAAMFGSDANWGRVLCAMGYSGASFDTKAVQIEFASAEGCISVCENGQGLDFDEALAKKILNQDEVEILVSLKEGCGTATCWGCDLTYDYVRINGDYRS